MAHSQIAARRGAAEVGLPPGSGTKLSSDLIAVTLHQPIGVTGADALIHLQPVSHEVVLLSLSSLGQHRGAVTVWQTPP